MEAEIITLVHNWFKIILVTNKVNNMGNFIDLPKGNAIIQILIHDDYVRLLDTFKTLLP